MAIFTSSVKSDQTTCLINERKYFVDVGFTRDRKPGDFDIYYECEFNNSATISSPDINLANEQNENVTEIGGHNIKNLEYLPVDIVNSFPMIKKFTIYKTSLKAISKKNFRGLRHLVHLSLSFNQISSIDENTFDDQVKVINIRLDDNKLTSLPSKVFSKLSNLDSLFLNKNQLTTLDAEIFANNLNLALLFLDNNNLASFAPGTFDSLTKLRQFWFNNNEISSLDSELFKNCVSVVDVTGSENKIIEIPVDLISTMTSLREFSFSQNPLNSVIDFKVFEHNKKITDISLSEIKFTKIYNIDVIDNLPDLKFVNFEIDNESCIVGSFYKETLEKLKQEVKANCSTE